jgi:3-hydroxyisobutyrate dehydrogenase-like beta-hydroxyacid dehydrogenase
MSQRTAMTDVTVIGLGRMGAALARALLNGGRSVSVWNRDASKAEALRQAGAHVCATLEDALRASSHIVVCVTGYTTWTDLLNGLAPGVLDGRTVIQLSNGAPDEARALRDLQTRLGAASLDGSILGFPSQVGAPQFPITVSGDAEAFARAAPVIAPLGDVQYVGKDISASSGLEGALVFFTLGSLVCYLQSAALLRASDVPLAELSARVKDAAAMLVSLTREADLAIASGSHRGTEATLLTHLDAFAKMRAFTNRAGASDGLLAAFEDLTKQAITAGHDDDELSALFEVLRPGDGARTAPATPHGRTA